MSLPNLTSYSSDNNTFQADGTGSVLDVSALTNVTQQGPWDIKATNGGTLNLGGLTSLTCTKHHLGYRHRRQHAKFGQPDEPYQHRFVRIRHRRY